MRHDPERFVTFVFGSFVFAYYLSIAIKAARIRRKIGRSPVVAFSQGGFANWVHALVALVLLPGIVLAWSHCPACFAFLPRWQALESWPVRLAGLAVLCAGGAVSALSLAELGDSWRIGNDALMEPRFVTTGIYARVRHPVYSGVWLVLAGLFFMAPNLLFAGAWVGGWAWILCQSREEERFLDARFGEGYRSYLASSGRFIPRRPL